MLPVTGLLKIPWSCRESLLSPLLVFENEQLWAFQNQSSEGSVPQNTHEPSMSHWIVPIKSSWSLPFLSKWHDKYTPKVDFHLLNALPSVSDHSPGLKSESSQSKPHSFFLFSHSPLRFQTSPLRWLRFSQKLFHCTNTRPRRTLATLSLHFDIDNSTSLSEHADYWWSRALGDWCEATKNQRGVQTLLGSISKTGLWVFPCSTMRTIQQNSRFALSGRLQSCEVLHRCSYRSYKHRQRSRPFQREEFGRRQPMKGRSDGDGRQLGKNERDLRLKTILKWESENEE